MGARVSSGYTDDDEMKHPVGLAGCRETISTLHTRRAELNGSSSVYVDTDAGRLVIGLVPYGEERDAP